MRPSAPWAMTKHEDARTQLNTELRRMIDRIDRHLAVQRRRAQFGRRSPARMVIEEDEAVGLLRELAAGLARPAVGPTDLRPSPLRSRILATETASRRSSVLAVCSAFNPRSSTGSCWPSPSRSISGSPGSSLI